MSGCVSDMSASTSDIIRSRSLSASTPLCWPVSTVLARAAAGGAVERAPHRRKAAVASRPAPRNSARAPPRRPRTDQRAAADALRRLRSKAAALPLLITLPLLIPYELFRGSRRRAATPAGRRRSIAERSILRHLTCYRTDCCRNCGAGGGRRGAATSSFGGRVSERSSSQLRIHACTQKTCPPHLPQRFSGCSVPRRRRRLLNACVHTAYRAHAVNWKTASGRVVTSRSGVEAQAPIPARSGRAAAPVSPPKRGRAAAGAVAGGAAAR